MSSSIFLAQLVDSRSATSISPTANARVRRRISNLSDLLQTLQQQIETLLAWGRMVL